MKECWINVYLHPDGTTSQGWCFPTKLDNVGKILYRIHVRLK